MELHQSSASLLTFVSCQNIQPTPDTSFTMHIQKAEGCSKPVYGWITKRNHTNGIIGWFLTELQRRDEEVRWGWKEARFPSGLNTVSFESCLISSTLCFHPFISNFFKALWKGWQYNSSGIIKKCFPMNRKIFCLKYFVIRCWLMDP